MRIRHTIISMALLMAAGCDTMENDIDGDTLSINNQPAYLLSNGAAVIDLQQRVISPGKVTVEIVTSTQNGKLVDLGKGLIQYTPKKGSSNDSFQFNVLSSDRKVLEQSRIDLIIASDTTSLPCTHVYAQSDSARNVSGPVVVDVAANDFSCSNALTISISVAPEHGIASVIGNKIHYKPGVSFTGRDQILYKATASDPTVIPGYAMLWITSTSPDSTPGPTPSKCRIVAMTDNYLMPANSNTMVLDVLANDTICNNNLKEFEIQNPPRRGTAFINANRKIEYTRTEMSTTTDTLAYLICDSLRNCYAARVFIKRQ